jgi:hypothetical protein
MQPDNQTHSTPIYKCIFVGCRRFFKKKWALTKHVRTQHQHEKPKRSQTQHHHENPTNPQQSSQSSPGQQSSPQRTQTDENSSGILTEPEYPSDDEVASGQATSNDDMHMEWEYSPGPREGGWATDNEEMERQHSLNPQEGEYSIDSSEKKMLTRYPIIPSRFHWVWWPTSVG